MNDDVEIDATWMNGFRVSTQQLKLVVLLELLSFYSERPHPHCCCQQERRRIHYALSTGHISRVCGKSIPGTINRIEFRFPFHSFFTHITRTLAQCVVDYWQRGEIILSHTSFRHHRNGVWQAIRIVWQCGNGIFSSSHSFEIICNFHLIFNSNWMTIFNS